jgi:hypothetical protein
MVRSPLLRPAALLAVLVLLLPLVAVAGACTDCLRGGASDCCPSSCCSCCGQSPSVLTAAVLVALHSAPVDASLHRQDDVPPTAPPHDVFHVPKTSLA